MGSAAARPRAVEGSFVFEHPTFGIANRNHYGGDGDARRDARGPPISARARAALEERNALDIELYARIVARFDALVARWLPS